MTTRPIKVGVVLGLLGLVGCGGGDGGLSRDEFLAQGNAICTAGKAELEQIFGGLDPASASPEDLDAAATQLADNVQGQIDKIRALNGPDDLEGTVDAILDDAEDDIAQVREQGGDFFADQSEDPFADVNSRLTDAGLTVCGQSQ